MQNLGLLQLFQNLAFSAKIWVPKSNLAKIWTFLANPSKILTSRENSEFQGSNDVYNLPKYLLQQIYIFSNYFFGSRFLAVF